MTPEHAEAIRSKGLSGFALTREERESALWRRFEAAAREERNLLREHLEHVQNIESTTLLRGQLQAVKQILARADEVGPESRPSEPHDWARVGISARAATGLPEGY
jgi:hypothetical protein